MHEAEVCIWNADLLRTDLPLDEQVHEALAAHFSVEPVAAFYLSHLMLTAALKMTQALGADIMEEEGPREPTEEERKAVEDILGDPHIDL
jgi:hypothetical protein